MHLCDRKKFPYIKCLNVKPDHNLVAFGSTNLPLFFVCCKALSADQNDKLFKSFLPCFKFSETKFDVILCVDREDTELYASFCFYVGRPRIYSC